MFKQLNDSISQSPLAAKDDQRVAGMPAGNLDNVNPFMRMAAQGVGNLVGTDPALLQTSRQKAQISNKQAADALGSKNPNALISAAQLMMQQGRTAEAQQLMQRAQAMKQSQNNLLDEKNQEIQQGLQETKDQQTKRKALSLSIQNQHPTWSSMLKTGDVPAQAYYDYLAEKTEAEDAADIESEAAAAEAAREALKPAEWSAPIIKMYGESLDARSDALSVGNLASSVMAEIDAIPDEQLESLAGGGGLQSTAAVEFYKSVGQENKIKTLRQRATRVINSAVMDALPTGTASDADVALARQGFPDDTASLSEIYTFMAAVGRIAKADAQYEKAKSTYMDKHNTIAGFASHWIKESGAEVKTTTLANF